MVAHSSLDGDFLEPTLIPMLQEFLDIWCLHLTGFNISLVLPSSSTKHQI